MAIPTGGIAKEVLERIIKELGLQTSLDKLPLNVIDSIQPVLISNPANVVNVSASQSATGTIYATPSDKDFYLTHITITSVSQNESAIARDQVGITLPSGEVTTAGFCACGSGAAETCLNSVTSDFSTPIKLKRGSTITATIDNTYSRILILGYLVD